MEVSFDSTFWIWRRAIDIGIVFLSSWTVILAIAQSGFLSGKFVTSYPINNPHRMIPVYGCKAVALTSALILRIYSNRESFKEYAYPILSSITVIIGMSFSVEWLFLDVSGPSIFLILFFAFIYTSPVQKPKFMMFTGILIAINDLIFNAIAQHVRSSAPNFASRCHRSVKNMNVGPGCAEQLAANAMLYLCIIGFGASSMFYLNRHAFKLFVKSKELESKVEQYTETSKEAARVALSLMPKKVWDDLRGARKGPYAINSILRSGHLLYKYEEVTILFGDIVGFTKLASVVSAQKLVRLLDSIFSQFDDVVAKYKLEKIKTIGDAYMVCAGLPEPTVKGPLTMLKMAKEMIAITEKVSEINGLRLQVRIGVHHGYALGGILGTERIMFDVWSEDVSRASKMEQTGKPSQVHVSETIVKLTGEQCKFSDGPAVTYKDEQIRTYFLEEILNFPNSLTRGLTKQVSESATTLSANSMDSIKSEDVVPTDIFEDDTDMMNARRLKWTNVFFDETLEEEYQKRYIQGSPSHATFSLSICFTVSLIFIPVSFLTSDKWYAWFASILVTVVILAILIPYHRAMIRASSASQAARGYSMDDPEAAVHSSIDSYMPTFSPGFLNQHIQIIAPIVLLMMHFSTFVDIVTGLNEVTLYYYTAKTIVVQLQSIVFPRIQYLHLTGSTIMLSISGLYMALTRREEYWLENWPHGYLYVMYLLILPVLIFVVSRHTEKQLRLDFLNGREYTRQKYLTDDIGSKTTELLDKLVPIDVVQRLRENPKSVIADFFEEGTILFTEISLPPTEDLEGEYENSKIMNELYTEFDKILFYHGVEKIKSIGTIYMVMAYGEIRGNPELNATGEDSTSSAISDVCAPYFIRIADYALHQAEVIKKIREKRGIDIQFKIGINVGDIVAGVIGKRKLAYDVWGDTVNVASRMASLAEYGRIQITADVANYLKDNYVVTERGKQTVKGKGEMTTFYLEGRNPAPPKIS
eukprot:Partr_v1_DN28367_c1_g1_i2_m79016 putative adenylate cyclase